MVTMMMIPAASICFQDGERVGSKSDHGTKTCYVLYIYIYIYIYN